MRPAIALVDGTLFTGSFVDFASPLEVDAPDGSAVRLRPWTYGAHLAALRDCVHAGPEGLVLDRERFAARVISHSGGTPDGSAWLAPLALWWAAGGDGDESPPSDSAEADPGGTHVELRRWTEGERLSALAANLVRDDVAGDWLDTIGYLDAMVRCSLVSPGQPAHLDEFDSRATARLLDRVAALNLPEAADDLLLSGVLPDSAVRMTVELCRRLGWTAAEVLAAPAAEVQRLMRLTAGAKALPGTAAGHAMEGLSNDPGAVVFAFEDDAP